MHQLRKIAVLGSHGFVGRHVIAQLESKGENVSILPRISDAMLAQAAHSMTEMAKVASSDFFSLLGGCTHVVNCAGKAHGRNSTGTSQSRLVNVTLPSLLFTASAQRKVNCFVHVSSVAAIQSFSVNDEQLNEDALPQPDTAYGREKREGDASLENIALQRQVRLIILMPPMIYGRDAVGIFRYFLQAAQIGMPLPLSGLNNKRSAIHVDNLTDAIACAIRSDTLSGRLVVTGGPPVTQKELYDSLTFASKGSSRSFSLPASFVHVVARMLLRGRANSLTGNAVFDESKFREMTGWVPPLSVAEAGEKCFQDATIR
jgi:UDP-glucose 4-epimerase